ncbi:MAG: cell division protein ZapA [Clostridia bacterium]|nr:cell division protein ZapA [Clostridia bacterium]
MSGNSHVKLKICGSDFVVTSDDSEQYIRQTGAQVEQRINKLIKESPSLSVSMAAVFAAMELCDEAAKSREAADNLRTQIREYLEEVKRVRAENDELRKRISGMGRERH